MGMLRSELELNTGISGYMAKSEESVQELEKKLNEVNMARGLLWERLIFGKAHHKLASWILKRVLPGS